MEKYDFVEKPKHYGHTINLDGKEVPYQTIDLINSEVLRLSKKLPADAVFSIGQAFKYMDRLAEKPEAGKTEKEKTIEDIEKAIWYLNEAKKLLLSKNLPNSKNLGSEEKLQGEKYGNL